ncbi:MAG: hypothetical protein R3E39_00790 [Anaerolineae bacterium]
MSDTQNASLEQVIACNPAAIDPANRPDHEVTAKEIFSRVTILEVKEMANGYGFRLPLETSMLHKVTAFVANERLCCPFFTFTLVIGEQFWLELSGTQEVKDYIKAEIVTALETDNFPTFDELQSAYTAATSATTQ